jgi:glutathione reductase (NADPH)
MSNKYDVLVLGGGSGGIAMAVRAAMHGQKVAVIEKGDLGGTCVNLGCVPKKVMWNASFTNEILQKASSYGFNLKKESFDWEGLYLRREAYIARLRGLYNKRFETLGITLIKGKGCFVKPHVISVNDINYEGKHIVIAAGAVPTLPHLPGVEFASTSDDFFALKEQPKKVAVIGSGYIGVEIAGVLNGLGTEVHLFYRKALPLTGFDETLQSKLDKQMQKDGVIVHKEHAIKEIKADKTLVCDKNTYSGFDAIFVTIGRQSLTDDLGLDKAGIEKKDNKTIMVDSFQETNVKHHYAIGDLTEAPQLTPVAIKAGRLLSERLFNGKKEAKLDVSALPTVVFSHPPIGTIGLSEEEARETCQNIQVYHSEFNPMFDALTEDKTPTYMKLITAGNNERIVGLHMIGQNVDEILQGFSVAIKMGATKEDFDSTIAIHPTSAEELVTMK